MLLLQGKIKIQKIILKISNDALFVEKQDIVKKKKTGRQKISQVRKEIFDQVSMTNKFSLY